MKAGGERGREKCTDQKNDHLALEDQQEVLWFSALYHTNLKTEHKSCTLQLRHVL